MRRLAMLAVCLLALVPAFDVAQAAGQQGHRRALLDLDDLRRRLGASSSRPRKVKRCTRTSSGRRPPKAGQELRDRVARPGRRAARALEGQDDQGRQEGHAALRLDRLRRRQGQGRLVEGSAHGRRQARSARASSRRQREPRVRVTVRLFAALRERAGTGQTRARAAAGRHGRRRLRRARDRHRAARARLRRQPGVRRALAGAAATATRSR